MHSEWLQEIEGTYEHWIFNLNREDKQMIAMVLYDNYIKRFGLLKTAAAAEVGLVLGITERSGGKFSEYQREKYERYIIISDEEYKEMALAWIRANASVKGRLQQRSTQGWLMYSCLQSIYITQMSPLIFPIALQFVGYTGLDLSHHPQRKVFTLMATNAVMLWNTEKSIA